MAAFKKLESFDGTEDVEWFIDRFEFAVTVDELPNSKKASYLAMHLTGKAFDVWKGMTESDQKDVSKVKEVLRKTYGIRRSAAWRAMIGYRIGVGEHLNSACEELHKWAKIVTSGKDPASALAAVAFVEALPDHVAQRVRVLCGQSATKEEVVEAAKDIWDGTELEVTASVNQLAERRADSVQHQAAQSSSSLNGAVGREVRRCYGCGIPGHLRRTCTAVCGRCGGRRHTERFCRKAGNETGEQ